MGIPKFFRWISERYPLTSQLITPNSIPVFDNLYLDMNGIIHNCSHPPSSENDPHFRITEEQMIVAIFAYIDQLFTKIKPQKVFFMAIDGVAPRAKMNQQRSRRFRTARDAREQREQAEKKGEKLPDEKAFDSNAITPGTPFMARLSQHLQYYVRKRISEDPDWQNIKVILSGHEVPGEGEHKIQEFIRLSKAQPEYNPNTRHCLYGLDADLIMLGLLSHDPHFCLLREEVTFGRKSRKNAEPGNSPFFLLHLSLMREYLDLEFSSLATQISFQYDLERIIDDFILMAIFVGNDFLPHLPDLHINEGALERIWDIYKAILPTVDGYLNEHGTISLPRLQLLLDRLSEFEVQRFEDDLVGQGHFQGSQAKDKVAIEKAKKKGRKVITKDQRKILSQIEKFIEKHQRNPSPDDRFQLVDTRDQRDNTFIQGLAEELHLHVTWDQVDDYGQNLIVFSFDMEGVSEDGSGQDGDSEEESEEEDEGDLAIQRILKKWDKALVVEGYPDEAEKSMEERLKDEMDTIKRTYYHDKLEISYDKPEDMYGLVHHYIEGLQWILNYYYKGVCSWSWFYKFHYSPRITDLKGLKDMKFEFDFGKPFTPFQQLMGVLPSDSQEHVPIAYRDLMYEEASTILDFYPRDFELDMNGKKQDWEAVVKIPFINQERLLRAMAARDVRLTPEERERNKSGVLSTQFVYAKGAEENYPSSLPGVFPDLTRCHCDASPFHLPTLGDGIQLILGLIDGVHLGASALAGFPSLATLPHQGTLGFHGVSVFQSESKNQSMIITITSKTDHHPKTSDIAKSMLGQKTYHSWPYLMEGIVVGVSDDMFKYEMHGYGQNTRVAANPLRDAGKWRRQADGIEKHYSRRYGVITGAVEIVLHIRPLIGLKHLDTGALVKDYEGVDKEITQAWQMSVSDVAFEDERYLEQDAPDLAIDFPVGERIIFLGSMLYGYAAQVMAVNEEKKSLDVVCAFFNDEEEENAHFVNIVKHRPAGHWYPSPVLSRRLGITSLALSRITSTLLVQLQDGARINIGLPLKFESRGLKVLGYTKRNDRGWEYSELAAQTLGKYKDAFPSVFRLLDNRGSDMVKSKELAPTSEDPDGVIREMQKWCRDNNLTDFETVSLFADELEKDTCQLIEQTADDFISHKSMDQLKKRTIRNVPRHTLLKPAQAVYRLQGQVFEVGHRVVMVQDPAAGGVSTGMKGVVVGITSNAIDVIWDAAFMGGTTLRGRCSLYRGSTVPFSSCLNLTQRQFAVSESARPAPVARGQFQPQLGPRPAVQGSHYQPSVSARRPPPSTTSTPQILRNPNAAGGIKAAPRGVVVGTNGHLKYSGATKGEKPQQVVQAPVSHRDQMATLLGGNSGPQIFQGTPASGGPPPSSAPIRGSQATRPPRRGARGGPAMRGGLPHGRDVHGNNVPSRGHAPVRGRGFHGERGRGGGRGGAPATSEA